MRESTKNILFGLMLLAVGAMAYCDAKNYEAPYPYYQPGAP